jgi:hypothetical protein
MAKTLVGLNVGISFAEVALWRDESLIATRRFYLPSEPVNIHLSKFLQEYQAIPDQVIVASRYIEKVLDSRLGGTVAQIVTKGFETWPILRQPPLSQHFALTPARQAPLASQELIFGLSARMNHKGEEIQPVSTQELENILAQFKALGVKRVCVNLLFAQMNSAHQRQVADFFKTQGFEVFASARAGSSMDEMPAWRRNLLNACLSGVFQEHFEEIAKAIESAGGRRDCICFTNSYGKLFHQDPEQVASSLFGWCHAVANDIDDKHQAILHLGLESFYLIEKGNIQSLWKSQWGPIEATTENHFRLSIQPTLEVKNNAVDGLTFGDVNLGYEPGPVCFGRGLRPMVVDLVCLKEKLELPQVQDKAIPKLRDLLMTIFRNHQETGTRISPQQLEKDLIGVLNHRVTLEVALKTKHKNILVSGFFARRALSQLQDLLPHFRLDIDDNYEWRGVTSLRRLGASS